MTLATSAPAALDKQMRLGSKYSLNADVIKIGKYGIGIKTIILPAKLIRNMPR
jgi:hypothetical protein